VIAIAPDLLSGLKYEGDDAARKMIATLPIPQVIGDLNATADYASKIPAGNGHLAVAGFCWGGGWAFGYATENPNVRATYSFYGAAVDVPPAIAKISGPIYGFYAEKDERVNATVAKSQEQMKAAGKIYEPVTYKGAGHGFMRVGESPEATPEDKKARDDAWARWKTLLQQL
jgi:carboxymethylenebutenolidase